MPYQVNQAEDDVNNILMDMVKVGESHDTASRVSSRCY